MNPTDMIFGAISQMTGGLIADLSTAMIAMVMFSFIAIGFDLLLDVLDNKIKVRNDHKKLTGLYSTSEIDNDYLVDGKLNIDQKP